MWEQIPLKDRIWLIGMSLFLVTTLTVLFLNRAPVTNPNLTPSEITSQPKFPANTCFNRNGKRESWWPTPDGIVIMRGYENYLVMLNDEADRVHGGNKIGWDAEVKWFEANHYPTTCPENWVKHKHKKGGR